ncbi:MAG: hypothetical protein ACXAC7_07025 [Candidatus Hodarchaeales archaeon]|jgi:hypothetical protein
MQGIQSSPLGILGSIFALIAMIGWYHGFYKVFQNYQETGKQQSQFFSFGLLSGGTAILFLAAEQIILRIFDEGTNRGEKFTGSEIISGLEAYDLALYLAFIAGAISALAILFFDLFSLSFFENKIKIVIIPAILLIGYVLVFIFISNPEWRLNTDGTDYDLTRGKQSELIMTVLFVIPLLLPFVVFLYTTWSVRGNTYNFRRLGVISILQAGLSFAYFIEIVGTSDWLIVVTRFILLVYPFLTWSVLNPNDRVKRILGATT